MTPTAAFSYDAAFERNLGWITEAEQLALRGKRVAIAGLGGVGGEHLITLARFGVGVFNIADFDRFSLANFNRQIGANVGTIDRPKIDVLEEMALAVNPALRISRFEKGVNAANLEAFLSGVDLFVDGLDFFAMDMRRKVFARCHELGIPAITAGPIGMSTGFLAFSPDGMSFEQYFRMEGRPEEEQYLRFYVGLVPRALHRSYLVDPSRLNLATKTGPSTGAACKLCAGVAAVMAVKLLLRRGDVKLAPWSQQYDAFRGMLKKTWLRKGLDAPLWRLKLKLFGPRIIGRMRRQPPPPTTFYPADPIDEILHAARWAPSGDNEQPWRFEKLSDKAIRVHLAPHDATNVYHYRDDEPNVLAAGMLLESLRVAASAHSRHVQWHVDTGPDPLRLHVVFTPDGSVVPDPLYAALGQRSVDRNRYRRRPLTGSERQELESSVSGGLELGWHHTAAAHLRFAGLSAMATSIRLRSPEIFPIHQNVIDWDTPLSPTKIPAKALGMDPATLAIMRWAMKKHEELGADAAKHWKRMRLLNRLGGVLAATLQMDYIPILFSAAIFTLRFPAAAEAVRSVEALLNAGIHIQRFWLTAARLGLVVQPEMAVLIFADYGHKGLPFTNQPSVRARAQRLAQGFRHVFGAGPSEYAFMGRIGEPLPRMGVSRSVRRPVADLMVSPRDAGTNGGAAAGDGGVARISED